MQREKWELYVAHGFGHNRAIERRSPRATWRNSRGPREVQKRQTALSILLLRDSWKKYLNHPR
ncbi:hypothetical protein M404DRAFT_996825 [Pisolithus tinctorius Marx 270]|uniref:Uncharacterized protein n=1 Tax=Pisolithus tinctorius Marx 270 TaxID=870435 RepID=A0A0C3KHQ5_PISTI|nr:hypothetical protein M404DRAFT_996825 [Pisolithus tinctorius Marx 270]